MKIVLINQYFPPDEAPTGLMLDEVAGQLAKQGHEVTVLCSKGGYSGSGSNPKDLEEHKVPARGTPAAGFRVVRVGSTWFGRRTTIGKIVDYLVFYLGVAWKLLTLKPGPDRMVALTTPPYLSILARLISKVRRADHAHWVMDLYPDVMTAHGMIRAGGILERLLGQLTRWGFGGRRSRLVLTLGPDMNERVSKYLGPITPRKWIPLWGSAQSQGEEHLKIDRANKETKPLLLMYSGNMGLGHRFGEFLEAALTSGGKYQWVFTGRGRRRVEIEEFTDKYPEAPVTLGDYVPREELVAHLLRADVHLASLEDSWSGTMVPSKLQGIFAIGRPVIFVGSETSSIGKWILESGGGWVVPPEDVNSLHQAFREAQDEGERRRRGVAALSFSEKMFSKEANAKRYAEFFALNSNSLRL